MDWMYVAKDRAKWWAVLKTVMNLRVPLNVDAFLISCGTVSFSGRTLSHGVSYLLTSNFGLVGYLISDRGQIYSIIEALTLHGVGLWFLPTFRDSI